MDRAVDTRKSGWSRARSACLAVDDLRQPQALPGVGGAVHLHRMERESAAGRWRKRLAAWTKAALKPCAATCAQLPLQPHTCLPAQRAQREDVRCAAAQAAPIQQLRWHVAAAGWSDHGGVTCREGVMERLPHAPPSRTLRQARVHKDEPPSQPSECPAVCGHCECSHSERGAPAAAGCPDHAALHTRPPDCADCVWLAANGVQRAAQPKV